MGLFDRFRSTPKPVQNRRAVSMSLRRFDAASTDRLNSSWAMNSQSLDWDLRGQLVILRARSRELCQNNDYAKKFLQMCQTHVVGATGFTLKVRVTEPDNKGGLKTDGLANAAIEKAFWDWAKRGNCDVTGRLSFYDLCKIYIATVARDGEVLLRKIYGKEYKYGFALQILDIDRLDVRLNRTFGNGNVIKMGVEINEYGKPIAYHLRVKHPGDSMMFGYTEAAITYERVPADEIYHHFLSDRPEQTRGVPWMHSAMTRLKNLGGYEEAAVIAARVGAAQMGFYISPEGDASGLADGEGSEGELYKDAEAGAFGILPSGWDFKKFDPDYPHQQYPEFVKACLRGIASGIGVAYNTLSNDLEGVNFSSIRTGVLEERDNWMAIQTWMIESFLDDVFSEWLKMALLKGMVKQANGSALPATKFDKFNSASWLGRRWQWVDPMADAQAAVLMINNGLKTRAQVIAEQGQDKDEVFAQLKEEQDEIKALGLVIAPPAGVAQQGAGDPKQGAANASGGNNGK